MENEWLMASVVIMACAVVLRIMTVMLATTRLGIESEKRDRMFAQWANEDGAWRVRAAKQIDPKGWVQTLHECYDAHITGDCPLCGAE